MHIKTTTAISYKRRNRHFAFPILIFLSIIIAISITIITLSLIPIKEKHYKLPSNLAPAQQLFRHAFDDGIYIPSLKEEKVDHLIEYLMLRFQYGKGILEELEIKEEQELDTQTDTSKNLSGRVDFPDSQKIRSSLLYVALPAYIAGSYEAGEPVDYGYKYEIAVVPSGLGLDHLVNCTLVTIDDLPPTMEKVREMVTSEALHNLELRTEKGTVLSKVTSLYGVKIDAHYTINDLWRFSDMMRFDLANIEGDSGGVATAYEVFLSKNSIANKHGEFVITGAIDVHGKILSVGGVKAKTYLAIKKSIPVIFVPNGLNFSEAIAMKERMKSDIAVVPIENLSNIEAYWNDRKY